MKGPITTHVLDTAIGRPAKGLPITLKVRKGSEWSELAKGITDDDGRIMDLLPANHQLEKNEYLMVFDTKSYFSKMSKQDFYPEVQVHFNITDPKDGHFHIPLLLSPFGYSTYRGS